MPENDITKLKYTVISVEKVDTPEGMPEGTWHHYVIGRGSSQIEGLKPGTLKAVTQHAKSMVNDLNERSGSNRSAYAPRQQK